MKDPLAVIDDALSGAATAKEGRQALAALHFEREIATAANAVDLAPGALLDFQTRVKKVFGPGRPRPINPGDPTRELDITTWARVALRVQAPHLFRGK